MPTKCNTNSGIRASCYVKQSRNVFERVTSVSSARRNAWKDNRLETYGQKYLRTISRHVIRRNEIEVKRARKKRPVEN